MEVCEVGKRRMALHNHALVNLDAKSLAQLFDPLAFMLSAAVCKQDERYALVLQLRQGLASFGDRV